MARYLSPEWLRDLGDRVCESEAMADAAGGVSLHLTQVVTGAPGGDVTYHLIAEGGSASLAAGAAEGEDVRFECDWDTAVAVAEGQLNAQDAFIQGRIRLHGDQSKLVEAGPLFTALDGVVASQRADTTGT